MLEDLFAVRNLDFIVCSLIATGRETQYRVVVKRLPLLWITFEQFPTFGLLTDIIIKLIDFRVGSGMLVQALLHECVVIFERALVQLPTHVAKECVAHWRHFHTRQRQSRCRRLRRRIVFWRSRQCEWKVNHCGHNGWMS